MTSTREETDLGIFNLASLGWAWGMASGKSSRCCIQLAKNKRCRMILTGRTPDKRCVNQFSTCVYQFSTCVNQFSTYALTWRRHLDGADFPAEKQGQCKRAWAELTKHLMLAIIYTYTVYRYTECLGNHQIYVIWSSQGNIYGSVQSYKYYLQSAQPSH
jgi:hypothetical protein